MEPCCRGRRRSRVRPACGLARSPSCSCRRQSGATEGDGRRGRRLVGVGTRGALVVVQVALSLVLLIGAALMAQTIARLTRVDLGFPSMGLLTMRIPLPVATYDTGEKRARF